MKETKNSYSEDAYQKILGGIMSGELKPGLVIAERDLSEMYGLGRTPIREALKRLEGEGFIINSDRKKRVYELSTDDIREIFELKGEIEGMVAARAAKCTDKKEIKVMEEILREMEELKKSLSDKTTVNQDDIDRWLGIDCRFHEQLYVMAANSRAKIIVDNLNAQWHRIRVGLSAITSHIEGSIKEHVRIGGAVIDREPEIASAAIKAHFNSLKDRIITLMNTFQN